MQRKTLGQFIAELRKEKGLTQRELAEKLQVSDKTISHWERDESSPDISLILAISDIFGITADELLKREKAPVSDDTVIDSQSENSMKDNEKKKKSRAELTPEERFRRYRLLSLIGTAFGAFALISMIFSGLFVSGISDTGGVVTVTKTFPLLSVLRYIIISLVATVAARIYFSHVFMPPEDSEEAPFIYKANRIFTLNLYIIFAVLIFGIAPLFSFIPYITLYLLTALVTAVGIAVIDSILKAKGLLKPKNEKLFRLRVVSALIAAILILACGGVWVFVESYTPTPKEIAFDNIEDFVAYMETPNPKPENAWMIDGVEVTYFTEPPEVSAGSTNQSPVQNYEETTKTDYYTVYVFDMQNNKTVSFKLLNGNVYRYRSSAEDEKYYVLTYKEELKEKNWGRLQDSMSMIMPLYCVAVIVLSFIVYMIKAKKYKKG